MLLTPVLSPFGIIVLMNDYASMFDYSPVSVPAGMHALIRVNAQKYSFDSTIRYCLTNPEPVLDSLAYTKELCQTRCMFNITLNMCGCRPFIGFTFTEPSTDMCTPLQMLTCVFGMMIGTSVAGQTALVSCFSTIQLRLFIHKIKDAKRKSYP